MAGVMDTRTQERADGAPRLSVVVPIYNVETYLAECLDSILNQTFADFELLCVNDGSTDGSLAILEAYSAQDPRVRVIDKPNAGYGNSVNRGIDEARGEYVSIIEPDDLIDRHMFEDLLESSTFGGAPADIVKSSYWNYYAPEGGEPYVRKPNLMKRMPGKRMRFNVHDDWEVLYHHPSIWSAIYRRDFIEEKSIRLIEPKGAGWADNPFFFETLCQADSIVWVPAAYYYYRQTNPESSSYLKDFHLPFDRLRDIRAVLERLGEQDPHILVCLYNRTFSYIRSVQEKFGYAESDSELRSLIQEALESMDPRLVFGAKRGLKDLYVDYYKDFMGYTARRFRHRHVCPTPRVTFVVPMLNCRPLLYRCLESIAAQSVREIEVVCVDLGSSDRSLEVAQAVAERDGRFRVVACGRDELSELLSVMSETVHAPLVCFVDPHDRLGTRHAASALRALASPASLALLSARFPYVDKSPSRAHPTVICSAGESFPSLCASLGDGASHLVVPRETLRVLADSHNLSGTYSYPVMALLALLEADSVVLAVAEEPERETYKLMESPLALLERSSIRATSRLLAAASRIDALCPEEEPTSRRGAMNLVVELFVQDVRGLDDPDDVAAYVALARDALRPFKLDDASPALFVNEGSFQTFMELSTGSDSPSVLPRGNGARRLRAARLVANLLHRGAKRLPTTFYRNLWMR